MVEYLSEEYMERAKELARDLPETPGASARVQQVVTDAPGGVVKYHTVVADGVTIEQRLGEDPDAEVTVTTGYADAVRIAKGELDANVAFMQGRVKVTGDMGKVLSLLPLTGRPDHRAVVERLRDETTF